MATTHDTVTQRLSEYLDGELTAAEGAAVDAHLAECAECRLALEQLRGIVAAAGTLGGHLPSRDLWAGVEGRIAVTAAPGRRLSFTLPQLAAAAVILMALSGGLAYFVRPAPAPPTTEVAESAAAGDRIVAARLSDPHFEGAVADLQRTLEAGRGRLDPETVRVVEQNLATIDEAIEQCRRALEADPANAFLNSHLVSARQRKLALLRQATALTTGS